MAGHHKLTGFRSFVFFGGIAGFIGLALYPIVIYPYFHINEYSEFSSFLLFQFSPIKIKRN